MPADKPKYLVVIFIDEPERTKYGGVIGAPVFREVATRVMAYEGQLPDPGALTPAQARAQARAEERADAGTGRSRKKRLSESIGGNLLRSNRQARQKPRESCLMWSGSPCAGLWKCTPGRDLCL